MNRWANASAGEDPSVDWMWECTPGPGDEDFSHVRCVCLSQQDKETLCGRCWLQMQGTFGSSSEGRDGCKGTEHPERDLAPCQMG